MDNIIYEVLESLTPKVRRLFLIFLLSHKDLYESYMLLLCKYGRTVYKNTHINSKTLMQLMKLAPLYSSKIKDCVIIDRIDKDWKRRYAIFQLEKETNNFGPLKAKCGDGKLIVTFKNKDGRHEDIDFNFNDFFEDLKNFL